MNNIDETRNYFLEEKKQYELMGKKHKKFCTTCTYFEHFINLASTITGCVSFSDFSCFDGIPIVCRTINAEL